MKNENIKQKLLNDLENYLGDDISMINHLKEVMGFAEKILKRRKWRLGYYYSCKYIT